MISRDSNLRRNKILIAKNLYLTKRIKKKKNTAHCLLLPRIFTPMCWQKN